MFCPNCGKQIDDNSRFCEFCGATLSSGHAAPQQAAPQYTPPAQQQYAPVQQQTPYSSYQSPPQKKKKFPWIAVVAVVAVIGVGAWFISSRSSSKDDPKNTTGESGQSTNLLELNPSGSGAESGRTGQETPEASGALPDMSGLTQGTPPSLLELEPAQSGNGEGAASEPTPSSPTQTIDQQNIARPAGEDEFDWYAGVLNGNFPADTLVMKDPQDISGRWKAMNIYTDSEGDSVAQELLNIDIMAGDGSATVVFDWYMIAYNGDSAYSDESDMEDTTFYTSVSDGSLYGGNDFGTLDLMMFYRSGGKEYGVGSLDLPDGGYALIALVRP